MKRIVGILAVAFVMSFSACNQEPDKKTQLAELKKEKAEIESQIAALEAELKAEGKMTGTEKKTVPVSVATVAQDTFIHYLEVQGRVDFDQNVLVSSRVPGVLTGIRVQRGQQVSKGQTLATVDATVLEQNMEEVRTRLELAKIAYEKQKNLWEQKIGTEMQYLTAKNNYETLQRSLATLQQQRNEYNIKAPISGVVDNVIPNVGEAVSPGLGIIRVVNTSGGKIVAEVSEAYTGKIKEGDQAVVYFPDLNKEVETTVKVVSHHIDLTNRSFTIELGLKNSGGIALRPNLMAVVRIQDYQNKDAIVLPVNLIQKDEKSSYVYVAQKQGNNFVATRKEIETGSSYKGSVEVLNGLSANDQVITAGYQNLVEGQPVVFSQVSELQK